VGNGEGEIHPAPARRVLADGHKAFGHKFPRREEPPRNTNAYRITEADRLGDGGPKQKFQQNLAAIRALRTLHAEERPATAEEKSTLIKYVGWGAMPQVFDDYNREWRKERDLLAKELSPEEYELARSTTLNAHYTAPTVIRAMYGALERFGFQGGRVLEPACGIGHFIGLMPDEILRRSTVTGIEIDPLTSRIAKALYPDADIRAQPFEQSKLADGYYDLAISNVPFGDYPVHDPKWNDYKLPIHDYFFAAALDKVRAGGLVMFITSRGTMDKLDSTLRELLSARTELLGAIRLPNDAFKKNAGTEVTTDIVMLRKLHAGEAPTGSMWKQTADYSNDLGEAFTINEYFATRSEMMLGQLRLAGRMYRDNEPTLEPDSRDLGDALKQAVERLPQGIYQSPSQQVAEPTLEQTIPAPDYIKPNAYCLHDGMVCIREDTILRPLSDLPSEMRSRIRNLIPVRDAVRECLRAQLDGSGEERVLETRQQLNLAYDRFVGRFGPINTRANQRAFDGDPDLPLLLSLEHYNDETKVAKKAAIFRERTIQHRQPIETAANAKEALLVTLNERGRVDLDHMARLLGKPADEFLNDLKGLVFLNPQTNQWETDDQYLSGNVREKLAVADAAAVNDSAFTVNVEALKSVQPADLNATEIDVRLGASWLPQDDVKRFVHELLKVSSGVEVGHVHALGSWYVKGDWEVKGVTANTTDWGTDRCTALDLIDDALNLKTPTVYDLDEKKNPIINAQATEAAREKQERIKERFKEWIWSDDSRRERLCRLYNDVFNHTRLRTFNGEHLTLPGASQAITLQSHQKAGVWRVLQTQNTLLAHVVGAGKTFTMVASAMELKRLGLARKPLFTVPNHMLGQFSTELLTLYPGANILVAGKEDFEAANRKKLFSRIATGNWDAIIVTNSGFERIPLSQDTQRRFFEEQLHELEMVKRQHADSSNRRLVKELEKAKKRLEARLQGLAAEHKKDNTLTFEELGVDRLFVDEAHYFKNLFYVSKMTRIAGLPQTASERAFDMFLKVRHVQSVNSGGGVVFATGTPIANSMAEMFTMQRYLQPDELKKHHLHHFDSWAATFGEPVTAMELSPDGAGYRLNTRFARFINVPELMQMFRQAADVQTAAMLNLPRPKLENEKPTIRNAPPTPELKEFVQSLAARADRLRTSRVDPSVDNMLKITSEGRKAALDMRLVRASAPDEPSGKVNLAVENIIRIWSETTDRRCAQLVFCDLSTPKDRGFSVYRDMADKLQARGIPETEIAFIQDYDSDAFKLALFKDVRSGKVRVLFGSTQKMGSGTNVQERLIALHHLDAPWRPADVEQREGRILRQGNKNPVVSVFRYVTEGSFDAYMWQTLETKAKFIAQVMTGDMTIRRVEDLDSAALTYAEVKAIASGNPLVIEKAQVDAELMRLTRLRSAHAEEQYRIRSNLRHARDDAESSTARLTNLRLDIGAREDTSGDNFRIELDGEVVTNRGIAGELLIRRAEKLKGRGGDDVRVGKFAGFDLFVRVGFVGDPDLVVRGKNTYAAKITDTALGTIRSLESTVQGFEERAGKLETAIGDAQKRATELEGRVGAPFDREERYQELTRRQEEIEEKLDLTKNQAPSQVEASPSDEATEAPTEKQTTKPTVRPKRQSIRV
jgi:N12 class adenine-specific DNA methylase